MQTFRQLTLLVLFGLASLFMASPLWAAPCDTTLAAAFTYTSTGLDVQFINQSTGTSIDGYHWTFGDGGQSYQQNPSHTYPSFGTWLACLTVIDTLPDSTICTDTLCQLITLVADSCDSVMADFAFTTSHLFGCFTSTSTGWNIDQYIWDFGDGITTTTPNTDVSHQFGSAGTYNVCLTIVDSLDSTVCRDTVCQLVTVTDSCAGLLASFNWTDQSSFIPGQVLFQALPAGFADEVVWTWGDGTSSTTTTTTTTHSYACAGKYSVCARIRKFYDSPCSSAVDTCEWLVCRKVTVQYGAFFCFGREGATPQAVDLMIFPQPATDRLTLRLQDGRPMQGQLTLRDLQGRLLLQIELADQPSYKMDVQDLAKGVYLLEWETGEKRVVKRVVVR